MASIAQLNKLLTDFANYKCSVSDTAGYLTKSSNLLGNVIETSNKNYRINDDGSSISEVAQKIKESSAETSNYLKNTVLPAIDTKMEEIKKEIERLEEEERRRKEEEERRRKEEEERHRKEEAAEKQKRATRTVRW